MKKMRLKELELVLSFMSGAGTGRKVKKHQEQHRPLESQEPRKQERSSSPIEVMASTRAAARHTVRSESFRRSLGPVLRENSDLHP